MGSRFSLLSILFFFGFGFGFEMPSKTKDKSTVELGSFGEAKGDEEHDMDEIPPDSSFYSPKFIAVLDKLSTLFGAPLTLLIYGLVSFFLSASSSEEISPASCIIWCFSCRLFCACPQ